MPIAIVSCWPDSVAIGSGTAVAQRSLATTLELVGVPTVSLRTSHFATDWMGLAARWWRNRTRGDELRSYGAILGIDGEAWPYARRDTHPIYVAVCKAVLADVVGFERGAVARILQAQARWEGAAARGAAAVIAASEYAAAQIVRRYAASPDRVHVIPEPFDFQSWRALLPTAGREPLVLAVGHLYPRKNYAPLIQAWDRVAQARPEARLVLVGTGPEEQRLRRLSVESPSISLLGHVPFQRLLELYARASVFCHPSLQENFGIAVVEAIASGLKVVAHRQPAVQETLQGINGAWTVNAREPVELASALIDALHDSEPGLSESRRRLAEGLAPRRVGGMLRTVLQSVGVPL